MTTRPEDCQKCQNYETCVTVCIYVDRLADGNVGRKEPLYREIRVSDNFRAAENYNDVLARKIKEKQESWQNTLPAIMELKDGQHRMIAGLRFLKFPLSDIANALGVSRRTISRKIKELDQILHVCPSENETTPQE